MHRHGPTVDAQQCAQGVSNTTVLKEAAVKARGEALAPGLASYGFELTEPTERNQRILVSTVDAADTAHYSLLNPLPDYRLAICWQSHRRDLPRLKLFELQEASAVIERSVALRASSSPLKTPD